MMWITSSTISKWHRLSTFTTNRSIMTKESNVVGLTDGSPGFTHAKYYRSLRSETPLHRLDTSQFWLEVAYWPRSGGI